MRALLLTIALSIAFIGSADARPKKKVRAAPVPEFSAKSFLVADADGSVLKEKGMDTILPIASISKLMIGLLAAKQDLDEPLGIPKVREVRSSIPRNITHLSRRELLTLSMVKSDNLAAQVLCTNLPNCVERMNSKADEIGMTNTNFVEPTGLSAENTSTANDLLKLMLVSSHDPILGQLSSMPNAEIHTSGKPIRVKNTNPLTAKYTILLSKTGYTRPAGGCLVMIMESAVGQRILILLGSKNSRTRIPDMERLVKGLD